MIHRKTVKKTVTQENEHCKFRGLLICKEFLETIEHIYVYCTNANKLWNDTISWVRNIYDHHSMISDHEKIFRCSTGNQDTHLIITSAKDVIYQKRKISIEMIIVYVQNCLLKI